MRLGGVAARLQCSGETDNGPKSIARRGGALPRHTYLPASSQTKAETTVERRGYEYIACRRGARRRSLPRLAGAGLACPHTRPHARTPTRQRANRDCPWRRPRPPVPRRSTITTTARPKPDRGQKSLSSMRLDGVRPPGPASHSSPTSARHCPRGTHRHRLSHRCQPFNVLQALIDVCRSNA